MSSLRRGSKGGFRGRPAHPGQRSQTGEPPAAVQSPETAEGPKEQNPGSRLETVISHSFYHLENRGERPSQWDEEGQVEDCGKVNPTLP